MKTAVLAAAVTVAPGAAIAQNCADCHADPAFEVTDSSGAPRSLFVTDAGLLGSVHEGFGCADCHAEAARETPHPEKLPRVQCGACHEDVEAEFHKSIHFTRGGADAPTCTDCHGTHKIMAAADTSSMVNPLHQAFTCARCHSNPRVVEDNHIPVKDPLTAYRGSVHGWLTMVKGENAATCSSCHGGHAILPADDPASTIYRQNLATTCGACHDSISVQYKQSVHGVAVAEGVEDSPTCNGCHSEHDIKFAEAATSPTAPRNLATQTCGRCHGSTRLAQKYGIPRERVASYEESFHGLALRSGNLAVANCASCHGVHNILPSSDPRSMIAPQNLEKTCGTCHRDASANYASGPVHLIDDSPPAAVNRLVRSLYLGLIVFTIAGMFVHNGLDFVRKARHAIRKRRDDPDAGDDEDRA